MSTVAFLGLGHMGGPMAANLVAAGYAVRGFDPVAALAEAAADKGAQIFDSVAQAASEADVGITSLPNGDIVKAVSADGAAALEEKIAARMTREVVSCQETDTLDELMAIIAVWPCDRPAWFAGGRWTSRRTETSGAAAAWSTATTPTPTARQQTRKVAPIVPVRRDPVW